MAATQPRPRFITAVVTDWQGPVFTTHGAARKLCLKCVRKAAPLHGDYAILLRNIISLIHVFVIARPLSGEYCIAISSA
jgi:hypothetical protein